MTHAEAIEAMKRFTNATKPAIDALDGAGLNEPSPVDLLNTINGMIDRVSDAEVMALALPHALSAIRTRLARGADKARKLCKSLGIDLEQVQRDNDAAVQRIKELRGKLNGEAFDVNNVNRATALATRGGFEGFVVIDENGKMYTGDFTNETSARMWIRNTYLHGTPDQKLPKYRPAFVTVEPLE